MTQFRFRLYHAALDAHPFMVVRLTASSIVDAIHKLDQINSSWERADPY